MLPPNTPTTSSASESSPRASWGIAFILLFVILSVFLYLRADQAAPVPDDASLPTALEEPVNPLEAKQQSAPETIPPESATPTGKTYFVSPSGNDKFSGLAADQGLATIQAAIDRAEPGDTVRLADGVYLQDIVSKRNGRPDQRITITGSAQAIVQGGGNGRVIEINHDYLTLTGFTVDGHFKPEKKKGAYRDKLVFVLGKEAKKGVTGLRLLKMQIQNAGGECVRLRYFAEKNEIADSLIRNCGVRDFVFDGDGKNGEGVYIGTAPEQEKDGTNPTKDRDVSKNNWIHHNTFDTQGNECVDIKEGATHNIIEHNSCTGQRDKDSGGLGSRGNENVFRFNEIFGNRGAGIRLGGDKKDSGINNFIHDNTIRDNEEGGIKIMRKPQAKICGNTFSSNQEGKFVGEYGDDFKDAACPK